MSSDWYYTDYDQRDDEKEELAHLSDEERQDYIMARDILNHGWDSEQRWSSDGLATVASLAMDALRDQRLAEIGRRLLECPELAGFGSPEELLAALGMEQALDAGEGE